MSSRRAWLLALLAASALLSFGAFVKVSLFIREGYVQQDQGDTYAVYIDGGSSGTRVRVFRYRPARWPSYVALVLPEPSMAVEPGLSAYATDPERAGGSLRPLLDFAYQHVPEDQWGLTPVRLLATAGLRMLADGQQAAILAACASVLATSRFAFEPSWAAMIDGVMEGLYGWAAVNYITGALQEVARHAHHSRKEVLDPSQLFTGLLEMGGASMQVTFLPPATARVAETHGLHLKLPGVPSRLFTHSYLGLGMDAALARAAELVLQQQPRAPVVADPCLPTGYVSEDGRRHGNASFAHCLAIVSQIIPDHNCSNRRYHEPPAKASAIATAAASDAAAPTEGTWPAAPAKEGDTFAIGNGKGVSRRSTLATDSAVTYDGYSDGQGQGTSVPAGRSASTSSISRRGGGGGSGGCTLLDSFVPALSGRFVAVENFAWTARALGLPETATLRQLREQGRRYCSRQWSSLHAEFSGQIPDQYLVRYCFGAAYILVLLHSGLGLPLDDTRLHWTNSVRERGDGAEVGISWVLGAALVDAMNGGTGQGGQGGTGSVGFWTHDEHDMAASGAAGVGVRAALLLPLAALLVVAVVAVAALLRAAGGARGGKGGFLAAHAFGGASAGSSSMSSGMSATARSSFVGPGVGVGTVGEELVGEGPTGRGMSGWLGRSVPTVWSSSSLVSEPAVLQQLSTSGPGVHDAGARDPGLGLGSPAAGERERGLRGSLAGGGMGHAGPPLTQEGGSFVARHGGVLKAAGALSATMRRTSSFTAVVVVGPESPGPGQQ